MGRTVTAAASILFALSAASLAWGRPAQLPSPTAPLDGRVPFGGATPTAPTVPFQLPPNARSSSSQRVIADLLDDGTVVRIRVLQRLVLTGTGDFFFSVPAPLRDVRALPGSEGEPGLRPNAIVWQGFSAGRRVLGADAQLVAGVAARSLPLRLELRATVDGRPLTSDARQSGRLVISLRLRNTTAVRTLAFSATARPSAVRPVLAQIADEVRRTGTAPELAVEVDGPTTGRHVVVDAPLVVRGELRLPVSTLEGARVRGGSLTRRRGFAVLRFQRVVGGAAPQTATISLDATAREAGRLEADLSAQPTPLVPELDRAPRAASGSQLVLLAGRSMLRLARVHQYATFLATPAPGRDRTSYRFRTVAPSASPSVPTEDHGLAPEAVILVAVGIAAACVGAIVLWAQL